MTFIEKRSYYKIWFVFLLVLLFILIFFISTIGVAHIPFLESIKIIWSKIPILGKYISMEGIKESHVLVVLNIRLPRIILCSLIGMALAGTGTVLQGIFKNPMADPYVLGISSGAALGATIAIILGFEATYFGFSGISTLAFMGAIFATFTVYNISRVGNNTPVVTLLLSGVALNSLLSSLISLMMTFHREEVEKIVFWTMGSVSATSWKHVIVSAPVILIGCGLLLLFSRDLNVMLMGEETAKGLGIEVEKLKKLLLIITSIIGAAAVSVSGIIGFVGLIIPHIIRLLVGPDHRVLIPFTLVGGAIFMILADTLARTLIPPTEIPLGVITALFGGPYFIYLLNKNKKDIFKG